MTGGWGGRIAYFAWGGGNRSLNLKEGEGLKHSLLPASLTSSESVMASAKACTSPDDTTYPGTAPAPCGAKEQHRAALKLAEFDEMCT